MFSKSVLASTISITTTALLAGIAPASAVAEQITIEEIVVTARKRAENLQEVPIAITAFTEKTIEQAGIERPQDFIALTPNVNIVDTANVGDTQVTIRGQVSTRDAESTFAYVVDGVLITNPNGFNEELFDVQQIEVLKGPQGALYGRNAVAGAIIVTTKRPGQETEAQIRAGVGDDDLTKVSGVISGPLTDTIAGRIAVSYRDQDGQWVNSFTGQDDINGFEDTSYRGRLVWDVSDTWSLDMQAGYSEVDAGSINFNSTFQLPAFTGFGPLFNENVNDHNFVYVFNTPNDNEQESTTFSIKSDSDMDWADLTVVFAYDQLEESLISDGTSAAFRIYAPGPAGTGGAASAAACQASYDATTANPANYPAPQLLFGAGNGVTVLGAYTPSTCDGYQYQERNQDSTSLEVRLASKEDGIYRWITGVYMAEIEREVVVSYGADLADGFSRQPYVVGKTDLLFWDDFDTSVLSAFGQLEYDITADQEIAVALRWDREEREVDNKVPNVLSAQANGGGNPINPAYDGSGTDSIPDRETTFVQFQPKVSWNWQLQDNYSLYANYGVGFRSGGFNNLGSEQLIQNNFGALATAPANVRDEYDKEISTSFEVGVKSEWLDKRLRVNAAAFTTEVEDYQFFNFFAGGFGILRVVNNVDEVTINGFEADFSLIVTDAINVYGAYGLIDSEIDENNNRPYTEGNDVPFAPEQTANLGVSLNQPIANGMEFVARLDWRFVGDTWFHTVQDGVSNQTLTVFGPPGDYKETQRDAYDTLDLRVSLETEQWAVTAWGSNITDEDYLEEVIPAPEFGGSFIYDGQGEAYGIDFTYNL